MEDLRIGTQETLVKHLLVFSWRTCIISARHKRLEKWPGAADMDIPIQVGIQAVGYLAPLFECRNRER
jgi:hypothetical protein